ncbi:MAG: hypothetical protein J6Q61_06730 [Bacteroidales bacterium]|nr:hypothetical protein [Bacteroidales bacterium]
MAECKKCLYYKSKQKCAECERLSNPMQNNPMFIPNTNYDLLKNMTVDELARFLAEHIDPRRAPYKVNEIYANETDDKTGKGIIWIEAFRRWLLIETDNAADQKKEAKQNE